MELEKFKLKKLIKKLSSSIGDGTSMVSLVIPAGSNDQLHQTTKMLTAEFGSASNVKSRVTRQSVQEAIMACQHKLKEYKTLPKNGLIVYSGRINTERGTKKITIGFEPYKQINTKFYKCDSVFHTEVLDELLNEDDSVYGYIIIDGNGFLLGSLSGNNRNVLYKTTVDLPKKMSKGGQSAQRFGRIRLEKRQQYTKKVAEKVIHTFITDNRPNVKALFIAGSADFKKDLYDIDTFDPRLKKIVLNLIDISYGMENGFNQAIEESKPMIADANILSESRLFQEFFNHIVQDTGLICFGYKNTMEALETGAVEKLIVWENFKHDIPSEENEDEVADFVDWIVENYSVYGTNLEVVSDATPEGSQFCQGFGGIGGILRYKLEFHDEDDEWDDEMDEDFEEGF